MIGRALFLLPAAGVLLAVAATTGATTPGGGSKLTDCLAEFAGTPANRPATHPRDIRCVDGDATCDEDPTPGVCGFHVGVCLNVTDAAFPACAPADLEGYAVENEQPDTNPRHDFDFQGLEDELVFLTLPVAASQQNVCTANVPMSVYLPVRFQKGGAAWRKGKKTIRATLTGENPAIVDEDKMKLTCLPAEGSSPCDGVTSTFDQIQQTIFTPVSCARSTCHNTAQEPHNMSLAPDEAYGYLVGVSPTNLVAQNAGKLRVDPGNPANSFILDKLHGTLLPGEGDPMPLQLKRLPDNAIRLIEEWITAGAPATGFVAPSGCPGP
jgi:hypothetical protein